MGKTPRSWRRPAGQGLRGGNSAKRDGGEGNSAGRGCSGKKGMLREERDVPGRTGWMLWEEGDFPGRRGFSGKKAMLREWDAAPRPQGGPRSPPQIPELLRSLFP